MTSLVTYLLTAMITFAPPTSISEEERYKSIAIDVAKVVEDPSEKPLFKDDEFRVKTGLLMISIAYHEAGSFAKNVDEGKCYKHQCDHGNAFSMWQIHPHTGLVFSGDTWDYVANKTKQWRKDHVDEIITGSRLVQERQLAIKVALRMARQSLRSVSNLCIYTGEWNSETGKCIDSPWRARARMNDAILFLKRHPYETNGATFVTP